MALKIKVDATGLTVDNSHGQWDQGTDLDTPAIVDGGADGRVVFSLNHGRIHGGGELVLVKPNGDEIAVARSGIGNAVSIIAKPVNTGTSLTDSFKTFQKNYDLDILDFGAGSKAIYRFRGTSRGVTNGLNMRVDPQDVSPSNNRYGRAFNNEEGGAVEMEIPFSVVDE